MENDPGASSGSGLAYERPPEREKEKKQEDHEEPKLSIVSELEKVGMTEVIKDFYEHKNPEPTTPSAGLTTKRYSVDATPTKGLLLNKKAE